MKVDLKVDPNIKAETAVFTVRTLTPQLSAIIERLNQADGDALVGYNGDTMTVLKTNEVTLFYTEGGKVYANTKSGTYQIKQRLYTLEEKLNPIGFIRISNAGLANGKRIRKLAMTAGGTCRVVFDDGTKEFASRRCMVNIKNYLGI